VTGGVEYSRVFRGCISVWAEQCFEMKSWRHLSELRDAGLNNENFENARMGIRVFIVTSRRGWLRPLLSGRNSITQTQSQFGE